MKKNNSKTSIRELAKLTGSDRVSIKKWLEAANVQPSDKDAALACIAARQKRCKPKGAAIDEATGLTWFQSKLREDTIRARRENRKAEAMEKAEWLPTAVLFESLRLVSSYLEQVPDKARAEFGLTDHQATRLQQMLDNIRHEGGNHLERYLEKQTADWEQS